MKWQPFATVPRDGSPFVFVAQSPATYENYLPIAGKFDGDTLMCARGTKWLPWGMGDPGLWAPIPEIV